MAYDELYDGDAVRPIYRNYLLEQSKRSVSEQKRSLTRSRAIVSGDAEFLLLARLMSEREYKSISAGVRQRGRAIRLFLCDHYFGDRSYEHSGFLSKSQVLQIVSRYKVPTDQPDLRPENIQFWYAPDIIRDEAGRFKVIEDNIGFVGGMGDLEALADASRTLGVSMPASRHPRAFYRKMIDDYKRQARKCGGGKTILLSYPKSTRWNHEDERFEKIVRAFQVTSVSDFRKLEVREDGLYHLGSRVGFVIVYVNLDEIDANFWQAVHKGQLGVSYAPGLEFVGDKSFCPIVERLVEFYLGQKCLLPSLATRNLTAERVRQLILKQREQWVIKSGRGQSGESVWVGKHLTSRAWETLLNRVAKKPGDYIAQRFCEPSHFLGHAVDLRPLALITPRGELISPIPWGRAAKGEKSKTNISCGGLLAPVAIGASILKGVR